MSLADEYRRQVAWRDWTTLLAGFLACLWRPEHRSSARVVCCPAAR